MCVPEATPRPPYGKRRSLPGNGGGSSTGDMSIESPPSLRQASIPAHLNHSFFTNPSHPSSLRHDDVCGAKERVDRSRGVRKRARVHAWVRRGVLGHGPEEDISARSRRPRPLPSPASASPSMIPGPGTAPRAREASGSQRAVGRCPRVRQLTQYGGRGGLP